MSFLLYYAVALLIKISVIAADYDTQPKVYTKNGDLILEAAYDHNISLRLSRDSSLLLNNVDIMDRIRQRYTPTILDGAGAKQLDIPSTEQLRDEIHNMHDDIQRLAQRLGNLQNRTRSTLTLGAIRRNLGRMRRLSGRLLVLEQNIAQDECTEAMDPCKNGGTCYDAYKGYHCECTEGWTGKTCDEDVDECYLFTGTDLGCQNNAVCTNIPGSYKCTCAKGFAGTHCRLRNSICQQYQSEELCVHGICVPANNQQGYTCICDQGWSSNTTTRTTTGTTSTTSLACNVDVNECEESRNPCHAECINLPGSFKCGPCPVGYTGNGMTCFDVDECATNNGGCSLMPKVRCLNTEGSYRCGNCPPGWIGDGHSCDLAPSNSCGAEMICHPQAKCEYISDMATCTCPHGMFGHGFGPQGCHTTPLRDSCEKHICQNNATCLSTGRSASCLCLNGYSGALCETVDGCHPNPCENGATCRPQADQTYKCSCTSGTTGKRCEVIRSVCASLQQSSSGELKYPTGGATEYAADERCAWIIRTTPSKILNITFTSFDVEEDAECNRDWLQIHDGQSLASQLIGRFCGKGLPMGGHILSSQHQLFFWFRSDNATNRPGFRMTWESQPHICGDTMEVGVGNEGVIRSPGYPGRTPTNRECQWEISAPYGYRFVIRIYEVNMGSRPNCTGDSLRIYDADFLLTEFCQTTSPEPLRSSSNKLKLHFHTDLFDSDSSFQLHYEVESSTPHCGGVFTDASGLIVGPSDQSPTCLYLIQQPSNTQIQLEFIDVNLFGEENCNLKSIEIFDGKTDEDSQLSIYCGGKKPEPVVSSTNVMLIRYKNRIPTGDLTVPFVKYTRVCEFRYFGPDIGVFTTPNYPSPYTEHITCTFHIYGPAKTVIHANFTDFSISETNSNDALNTDETVAASINETAVASAKDQSLTYVDVYLSASSKQRYYKGAPMELISELNKMTIVFHATVNTAKARGLRVQYSFEEIGCGGIYTANEGSFDKNLQVDEALCKYIFEAPEGMHIHISVLFVPLFDHIAKGMIFANATGGRDFLLRTTSDYTNYVNETFNFNVITILATPDIYLFDGVYEFVNTAEVCGGNATSLYGVVKSPNWPRPYAAGLDCVWVITAPFGNKIELTVQNFTLESTCTGDVLEIRNGQYSNSPLIGRYCGDQIPSRIPSFTNNLYLRFTSDSSVEDVGFHITWEQTETGCGGKLTSFRGSIHPPRLTGDIYVGRIPTCDWLIHVAQGSSVALSITPSIDGLEFCRNNRLQIFDGSTALKPLINFNCSEVLKDGQLKLTSSSNQVLIIYHPAMEISTYSKQEFILDYETNCNMVLDHIQGVIESPNFPELYPENLNCNWDIKAGSNNKIKLAFSHLSLEAANMECENDYVEISDMQNSDVLKTYHLCTEIPEPIISEGNHLRVRFVTDYSTNKNGFRAEYSRVGCGEYLAKEFGIIQSPNYPNSVDLDCDWYIEVPPGKQIVFSAFEFHVDTDTADCSTDALVVKESKNSSVDLLKECSTQPMPSVVTSTTNRLYIHYRSGPSRSRKYFKAFFHATEASCGGIFRGNSGTITSPNYPYNATQDQNCKWEISVPESYGIILSFKDFQMSKSTNCSDTSLKISKYSGTTETLLDKFCAFDKSRTTLISVDRLVIEYTAKGSTSWGRFSLDYSKACGGKILADSGFIRSHAAEDCMWTFEVPEGTLISLNILQMDCYCAKDAPGEAECIRHGLGFKVNYFGSDYATANYTNYFCEQHQSNLVFEASKLYVFANSINFHAKFSTTQHACGGAITSARGALASPYYPASYPANVECTWTISATAGNRLQLQFDVMDIATSEHCNEDFLEVRTWKTDRLLGVYCGNVLPDETVKSFDTLWIRFHSSEGSTGNGFKMRWSYAHLNEIMNMTSGIIESPPVAMIRNEEEPFAWRILLEREQFITLHFDQYNEGLSLYDGYDDTALPIPIAASPWRFVSSSNVVYLKTDNDNLNYFSIKWNITDTKPVDANTTTSKCHDEKMLSSQVSILVSSPNYPVGYEPNLDCDWIYKPANPNDHVVCELYEVKLEVTDDCSADYVQISTSADLVQWHDVEKLCNSSPNRVFHGTPYLKLDFVSDRSVNGTGFYSRISTKCGSNLTQSVGFIEGDKLVYETDCMWHIKVKPSRRILLQLDYPTIDPNNNNDCLEYAVIYDGFDEHAPIMSPGKICSPQKVSQILMNSTSNYLTIRYNLSLPRPITPPRWNLTYREYSECNEEFRLIPEASTINVTSPNYPNVPNPHTECEWRIIAPQGELIQMEFIERFDMNTRFCAKEFVELFDGSTSTARSLGHHCRKPEMVTTTQNILYMRYLTDINEPRSGFKARISISKCGGSYSAEDGVIRSTGYPNLAAYPSNTQCEYAISLPAGSKIRLVAQDINLPFDDSLLKSDEYLEIVPIAEEGEEEEQPIFIYGNTTKGTQFDLNVNSVIVRFHTFAKNTQYRGFALRYNRLSGQCNQDITGESGYLTLHFPKRAYFNSYCRWQITVPKGRRVRLQFLNMGDLKEQNSTKHPIVTIFNDREQLSKIISFDANNFEPHKSIQSTDNLMLVRILVPLIDFQFKSIKARYSSDEESPCPSNIDEDNHAGLIDIQDRQSVFSANYYCMTQVKLSAGETLVFNITAFEHIRNATSRQIASALSFRDNTITTNYRENLTEVLQPHIQTKGHVRIVQTDYEHIRRLTMGYRIHKCGGYFTVKSDFRAKQPGVTDTSYGAIMCVWTLTKPFYSGSANSEYSLTGNFTFRDSCEREFIVIKEGRWPTEPVKKICRDNGESLEGYVFKNSLTFIAYQSENYNSLKTQFSMATKKSILCGSETKVTQMNGILQVDKENYRNNQECSWVFYTQPGNYLQLVFFGRFFIESSPNCTNDYLDIQREEDGLWISDGRYCGREYPPVYNTSTQRIQVVFRTNEAVTGDGFSFFVRKHCSVTLNVTSTIQRIESPAPGGYRGQELQCDYVFISNETEKLINVRTAFGSTPTYYCRSGFTAYKRDENGAEKAGDAHCEGEFEERAYSYLRLSYNDFSVVKYTIEYGFDTCGGNITSSATTIRPLKHESHGQYANDMNCVWYVAAPADHSIAVRFKYFDTEPDDHVSIYSGNKIQRDKRLVQLSGNYTDKPPFVMVDHNQAVINAVSDEYNGAKGFEAQIVFLHNCNELIALTDASLPVILARNFKFGVGEEHMCLYRLSAPKGYRIRVDIKQLHINNDISGCANSEGTCGNGACNTVEILDSSATNQATIGKFCSRMPTTNTVMISTLGDAMVKFTANLSGQYSFEIVLTMEKSVCGEISDYDLNERENFTLTFPQTDRKYDANTHCVWHLHGTHLVLLHFNYIDLQNTSQVSGKCLDYVNIKVDYSTYQFCGHATNYSTSLDRRPFTGVEIIFHSDATIEGKGFELIVGQINKCNRTYTQLSGFIEYTRLTVSKDCNETIMVPENYNLNFYIDLMLFEDHVCDIWRFRITDLKTNAIIFDRCEDSYKALSVFTTTNAVFIEARYFTSIALHYGSSDRNLTRGCGGTFQRNEGLISSPDYVHDRNFSDCRWNIVAPAPNQIVIRFRTFDMGTTTNCHLDNFKLFDIMPDGSEKLLKTLCGSEEPDDVISTSNRVAIVSKKSPNFDGTGWTLKYYTQDGV